MSHNPPAAFMFGARGAAYIATPYQDGRNHRTRIKNVDNSDEFTWPGWLTVDQAKAALDDHLGEP